MSLSLPHFPGGAMLVDDDERIVEANCRAAKIFGRKRRELQGELVQNLIPDWDAEVSRTAGKRRVELSAVRPDGERRAISVARRDADVDGGRYALLFLADCEARKRLEAQVRDSSYGFRQVARAMPHMLWTCRPNGAAEYISEQWIDYTGQPLERHVGDGWLDFLHPEDQLKTLRAWKQAQAKHETFKSEFRVRRADGAYRWFECTCLPVRDRRGMIVRWMGSHVDVHEAQEMRRALLAERDRFTKLAETVPGAVYTYRVRPDRSTSFPFSSARIEDIYAFSRQELAQDASIAEKYMHPDDLQRIRESIEESERSLTPWFCEWRMQHPVRGEIWVEGRSVPTREPDGGTLWYGIILDITERKRAEEELRRSQARLEAAVSASGIGTWIYDVRTKQIWRDESLQRLVELEDVSGAEAAQRAMHPADWPKFEQALQDLAARKTDSIDLECRHVRRNGALQWIAITGRAERDAEGRIVSVTGACMDITQRKRAEEAQSRSQRIEALGTLAGGIAHDFNNILLAITGNARLALSELPAGVQDSPLKRNLLEIEKAGARAADLVHRILAFSRRQESRREAITLRQPVEEAVRLLRATVPAMIEISTRYADDAPAALADSTQIHQIVMNLVTNSAYAIGYNAGRISIELDAYEATGDSPGDPEELAPGRYARIAICDTGSGMDRATRERIFDPFFTTKPAGQGTGLGLSVVHGIMRSYQGVITVESEPGRGAAFRLYFPAAKEREPAKQPLKPEPWRGAGQRVLYVDDEEALVYLARRVLERMGYDVVGMTNPAEALDAFRADPDAFDVVVTDLSMPGMSGFHLARAMLEIRPATPILMTSGYVRPQDRELALQLGVRELILKPDTIDELGRALSRLFGETASRDSGLVSREP